MKKGIEKIKKMKKEEIYFLITYLILCCFGCIYSAQKAIHLGMKFLCLLEIVEIAIDIGLYYLIKRWEKKNVPLHKIYLAVAIVLGAFYIFAFPPGTLPDEREDYARALEISRYGLVTPKSGDTAGRSYPKNIGYVYEAKNYSSLVKVSNLKLEGEKRFYIFATKALYNFVCYIPQAIGIGLTSLANIPILFQIYFGKICNYALFVLLVYLSIKYIPSKKFLVFFVSLLPITLQEAASLAPDSMTTAASIALISFILWARSNKEPFQKKHYIALIALAIVLSLCKIVYLPLCLLIFLIPKEKFGNLKNKKIFCIIVSVTFILLNLIWLKYTSRYLTAFYGRSNSGEQLKYILSSPLRYVLVLSTTLDVYLLNYLEQMVGHSLGSFLVESSYVITILSLYFLIGFIRDSDKKQKAIFNLLEKCFIGIMIIGTIGLMFTSLYLQWNSVGSHVIDGIQGRYFIPLILPIATLFMVEEKKEEQKSNFIGFALIQNVLALVAIITTFI